MSGSGQEEGFGAESLFSNLFGNQFFGGPRCVFIPPRSNPGQPQGENMVHPLAVTLEDLYNGKNSKVELSKNVICHACKGMGGKAEGIVVCSGCNGCGVQMTFRTLGGLIRQEMRTTCTICQGMGKTFDERDLCRTCKGKMVILSTQSLDVHIDRGTKDGHKIYFAGGGDQHPQTTTGDLIFVLQMKWHDVFQRRGDNLFMVRPISLTEALCGLSFVIKHLDGRELLIKSAPGEVIKPDDVKGIRGEGMPKYKKPFEKGNLYIKFEVTFPENHYQSEENILMVEKCLSPRPPFVMPVGEHVEEVDLMDYTEEHREEAYGFDDEEQEQVGGLQCAQQM